jgi:glycosyltransferase involved in cell wall biosynthesis
MTARPLEMAVSVLVPVRKPGPSLAALLDALGAQTLARARFEVLLIDDGEQQGALEAAVLRWRQGPQALPLRVLRAARAGAYGARNEGLRAARGRALAFTDDDCRPAPSWLERGLAHLERHPRVAGRVVPCLGVPPRFAERLDCARFLRQARYVAEGFGATANLFLAREVTEAVGGFDERLLSGGDAEHGARAARAGFAIVYREDVVVKHPCRRTLPALLAKGVRVGVGFGQSVRLGQVSAGAAIERASDRVFLVGEAPRAQEGRRSERLLLAAGHAGLALGTLTGCVGGLLLGPHLPRSRQR